MTTPAPMQSRPSASATSPRLFEPVIGRPPPLVGAVSTGWPGCGPPPPGETVVVVVS